jgi:outer membrane protein assembly factor BamB
VNDRARLLVLVLVALALLAPASQAGARAATLALTPSVGPPSAIVRATGSGFGAQEVVDLAFDGAIFAHATTRPDGSFLSRLTVPGSALPGDHTVSATGETSGTTASVAFLARTDWPQFHRDPARSGENPYENVLSPSNVADLGVKWAYQANGAIDGDPVVVGGVVYFGDLAGKLYAVDVATGAAIWGRTVGWCGGAPAVVGGIVFTATCLSAGVVALDAATGEILWSRYTGAGVFGAPAVAYGMVYEGSGDGYVYAWDAKTGTQRWRAPVGHLGAGGVPAAVSGGLVFIGGDNIDFYAFDAFTGELVWTTPVRSYTGGATLANGVLYVGTKDTPPYHLYAIDASTGAKLWSRTVDGSECCGGVHGTPSVAGGIVYVGAQDGNIYAFDADTGGLRWTFQTGGALFLASPVVANGVVYVGKPDTFHALDARTGAELWSYATGDTINVAASVADGVVYVGSFDHKLYAFALPP